ncbi:hypothetical protein, partial [Acidithiobacillus ferrooxidans]|uniref:hypothetical protein n=1 Tax=Acidithiobacillus ferrooxidans TaxID=920 RepID=UPI001E43C735
PAPHLLRHIATHRSWRGGCMSKLQFFITREISSIPLLFGVIGTMRPSIPYANITGISGASRASKKD